MNKNFSAIILSAALICMVSCTIKSEYATSEEYVDKLTNNEELKIDKNGMSITAEQAINIATLFNAKSPITKSNTLKQTKDVVTISDKEGNSLMYAVNYKNNEGYTIVSASKNYYPILAQVEHGSFNNDPESGMSIFLEHYKEAIFRNNNNIDKDFLAQFRDMWRQYEKTNDYPPMTKSDDLISVRSAFVSYWEGCGYNCFSLAERPEGLSSSVYDSWCKIAEGVANPDYDYLHNSIIIRSSTSTHSSVSQLLYSTWHQGYPYNYGMSGIFMTDAPAGCVTIAIGQIMKYHQWPSRYSWSNIPNSATTYNPSLSAFLEDLFDDVILLPTENWSMATISPIVSNIISNNYGYDVDIFSHTTTPVMAALSSGLPVYMIGSQNGIFSNRHAWVCDGYNHSVTQYHFELFVLSVVEPPLQYEYQSYYDNSIPNATFHMNWGHSSGNNGWFVDNILSPQEPWTTVRADMILSPNN
ncbi:MAG: C10 family peptidase [Bacteroidales bacterium]|nr:C10 family peptidase [Bacteroidales bacterium]